MRKIINDLTHHFFHYLVLATVIFGGLFAFFSFKGYPVIQLLVGVVIALLYAIWGILHHMIDRTLTVKIVFEYLAVSIFAIIILWNILIL